MIAGSIWLLAIVLLVLPGRSVIWYAAEPGRTKGSANIAGAPWPPEERAILTLGN